MFNRIGMILAVALGRALGHAPASLHRAAANHNRTVDVLRVANVAQSRARAAIMNGARRLFPGRGIDRSKMHWGPNGAQATARRVRQQPYGHNAASALWVDSQGRRWHADPHGAHKGFYWDSATAV